VRNEKFRLNPRKTPGYHVLRALVSGLWALLFRPKVVGLENIPTDGPVLIAPIHRSNIDFAYVVFVTPRKTFFMAKDSLWNVPVLGRLLSTMGAFPVRRGSADRDSMGFAESVLSAGQALVLFPEGTRRDGDDVGELHDGAMFLAARHGARVVPVGIGGTQKAMPKGAKLPRPARTAVVVGKPLQPPTSDKRVSRSQLAEATEELRAALQVVYDEARALL